MPKQPDTLVFIRHGQSAANLEPHIINGRGNHHPLSPLGEQQAALVGPWLLDRYSQPDAVVASPAVRTRETARIALLAAGLDIPVTYEDDFQELSAGDWTGKLRAEYYTPEVRERMAREGLDYKSPGGQTMREVAQNMLQGIERLPHGTVWIFGHGAAFRSLVGTVAGWPYERIYESRQTMFNTSVTELTRAASGLHLVDYARVDHLPQELQTI